MIRPLVISTYPLTSSYRELLCRRMPGEVEFATVAQIRSAGLRRVIFSAVFDARRPIVVASEMASSRCIEPALIMLGTVIRGNPLWVAGPDGLPRPVGLVERGRTAWALVRASLQGASARFACWRMTRGHHREPTPFKRPFDSWMGVRVLYVKNTLSTGVRAGGSVGHVAGVVNALAAAGADVRMITTEPSPMIRPGVQEFHPEGMDVFGMPSEINIFRMQVQTIDRALDACRSWKPDLIYQRLTLGDCSGAVLSRRLGVPLVTEYNGSEIWCQRNWGAGVRYAKDFQRAEECMLRTSGLVFTISKVLHAELLSRDLHPSRASWYPNGIEPTVYDPGRFSADEIARLRTSLGFAPEDFVVTFVGTFGDWHGAEVFASAIAHGHRRGGLMEGLPIRFLFVGDGKNRMKAEAIVRASNGSARCTFLGLVPQERTPALLGVSDCFVSPHVPNPDGTEFFGSPTKLFEYMAMGKPIIASRLGQIAEVLSDRRTAILVTPGNVEELADAIQSFAAGGVDTGALGRNARADALARFTWSRHVEAMLRSLVVAQGS